MSVQDERELRERLGGLLDGVEPRPAPVFAAMKQGRGIKVRRWITVAATVAVLAGGAAALPAVLHTGSAVPRPAGPLHYSITVNTRGHSAPASLIASGKQDGHPWTIKIFQQGTFTTVGGRGVTSIGGLPTDAPRNGVTFESAGGTNLGGNVMFLGVVGPEVTKVVFVLPGGRAYSLTPVRYGGYRYVAIAIPFGIPVTRAAAYDGSRELSYAVPFNGTTFVDWLAPGQTGPERYSKTIGAGVIDGQRWRFSAQYGPWGYCYAWPGGSACSAPLGSTGLGPSGVGVQTCGGVPDANSGPKAGLAVVGPDVREVAIKLSGGGSERLRAVEVRAAGLPPGWAFAFALPKGERVTGSTEYGAAGQILGHAPASDFSICG